MQLGVDDPHSHFMYLVGLQLAHPTMQDEFFWIDILIGFDYYNDILLDRIISEAGPVAVESRLGYLFQLKKLLMNRTSSFLVNITEEFAIFKFWRTDAIGILAGNNEEDWLNDYINKIFVANGQFCAFLPWKPNRPPLNWNLLVG